MSFLKGLPALLGVVGFFAYLWAGQYRIGGELMKRIIDKLRAAPNVSVQQYKSMTPARIEQIVRHDKEVRRFVNEEDIKILRLIVILQYTATIVVLIVCASLVGLGVWLMRQPDPLTVVARPPTALATSRTAEFLLDLDPVEVVWDASGAVERVGVFLENVDSHARSRKKTVSADVRTVQFSAEEVHDVATTRTYRGKNRVRTVIEWSGHVAHSEPVDIFVGIQVQLMLGGTLITPKESRQISTMIATIDNSTESMPRNYCFTADFAGWKREGPLVAPLRSCNTDHEVKLPFLSELDPNRHAGLVFNQPTSDRALVRTCIAGAGFPADAC
ncbi:hypothetical protein [Methylobacterium planeticum]|uniref:Uncharacterized protein n=1 Tax=Methylobacterium planeticum TaxID=2615211 RepID=A0A6N6MII7_9HYPH|nr:hypothetical protein [Methylobacterium planeticum]KAB1068605.1 hypothetical protein F6X51_26610 [Methylobacterium planeticum]